MKAIQSFLEDWCNKQVTDLEELLRKSYADTASTISTTWKRVGPDLIFRSQLELDGKDIAKELILDWGTLDTLGPESYWLTKASIALQVQLGPVAYIPAVFPDYKEKLSKLVPKTA